MVIGNSEVEKEQGEITQQCVTKNSAAAAVPNKNLDYFEVLGEDAILSIFSFVANAPLEHVSSCDVNATNNNNDTTTVSELTDTLACVSKLWNELYEHDSLWKPALLRQLEREPGLWTEGLVKLVENKKMWQRRTPNFRGEKEETMELFLDRVREALGNASYKEIYQAVVTKHIRQVLPVFYMPGHVLLGGSYRLHLFEPRYRLLVAELLQGYPEEARQGGLTSSAERPAPVFIHANHDPFCATSPACLVQMVRCNISPRDGTADIMLLPIAYVWLEKVWIRPNSGNLHYAQCIRMGHKATREMHERINQETLESVLSRFEGYLDYGSDEDEDLDDVWDIDNLGD